MTQDKHTPGPWKIDPFTNYKTQIYGDKKHIAVALTQSSEQFQVTVSEAEANARLIAAAPELLEVLAGILEAENFYSLIDSAEYRGALMPGYGMNFKKRLDAGRAAIAKVRGQA